MLKEIESKRQIKSKENENYIMDFILKRKSKKVNERWII
jgi:hypothetical protein